MLLPFVLIILFYLPIVSVILFGPWCCQCSITNTIICRVILNYGPTLVNKTSHKFAGKLGQKMYYWLVNKTSHKFAGKLGQKAFQKKNCPEGDICPFSFFPLPPYPVWDIENRDINYRSLPPSPPLTIGTQWIFTDVRKLSVFDLTYFCLENFNNKTYVYWVGNGMKCIYRLHLSNLCLEIGYST